MQPETGVVGQISPQAEPTEPTEQKEVPQAPQEEKPTKVLPTERVAFAKQMDLLRAYAVGSGATAKPVTNADLANLTKLNITTVGLNNTFFADAGLISKAGNGYVPATEVLSYNRQLQFDSATASHKLAPILRQTWFANVILPRLQMRPSIPEKECIGELADAASASQRYTPQLRLLLDYLETAGLLNRDGGMVQLGPAAREREAAETPRREPPPTTTPAEVASAPPRNDRPGGSVSTGFSAAPAGAVRFNVDVSVDMQEMATWKPELVLAFFDGIARVIAAKAKVEQEASGR